MKDDMKVVGMMEENAFDCHRCRTMICCGDPSKGIARKKN